MKAEKRCRFPDCKNVKYDDERVLANACLAHLNDYELATLVRVIVQRLNNIENQIGIDKYGHTAY